MPRIASKQAIQKPTKKVAIDTETTGVDLRHGARPFLVTTCFENGDQLCWEWDVDPLTRTPTIPKQDLEDILEIVHDPDHQLILQNAKFDVLALSTIFGKRLQWPWHRTCDTLIAAHLLNSKQNKDLTSLAVTYLGVDIEKYETDMQAIVNRARALARKEHPDWMIAKKGLTTMPSAKEKVWKYDTWLPRLLHNLEKGESPQWESVTRDYANTDSAVTLAIWNVQEELIRGNGWWKLFAESMRVAPVIFSMEQWGVTVNGDQMNETIARFSERSMQCEVLCKGIASSYGFDLEVPKGGVNNSLREFVFGVMQAPAYKRSKKTGEPSMDAECMALYLENSEPNSKPRKFFKALATKRKLDTAISYMTSYRSYWVHHSGPHYKLHPSLNQTGTDTLRCSSNNPNEQNISKKEGVNTREIFGPPDDREWWIMDAENIELRIPAYTAGEQAMIDLFERPDDPPYFGSNHLLVFHILHPEKFTELVCPKCLGTENGCNPCTEKRVPLCNVYGGVKKKYASTWYQWTKNGNFAVQYGAIEESGTADRAYHVKGGQRLIKSKFKETTRLNQNLIAYAERTGRIETVVDKSVDTDNGYPLVCSRTDYGRIKPTVPLNYFVQGTAMWWMRRAMVKSNEYLTELSKSTGQDYVIVMQIHDELVFEFPRGASYETNLGQALKVKALMESCGDDLGIPIRVGVEYTTTNWDASTKIKV